MAEKRYPTEPTLSEVQSTGPLLRIWTCGPLAIEWAQSHTPIPSDRFIGRGAVPALGLLKVLLSQPNRFAARDWLLDQFWPESTTSNAEERLHNVATHLRQLVRLSGSQEKFLHYLYDFQGHGGGYRLSEYPLIWVDADALAWNVKEAARFERFGEDALSLWERAYQLASRGEFLPEERYSDWAIPRREEVAAQYRQSVHRYSALLRERGATEQAVLFLRSYWQQHLLDEDVLRPLMEVLGEQERYQEAEESYQRLVRGLQDDDLLDGEKPREPDARTQDLRELLHTKQLRREPKPTMTSNGAAPLADESTMEERAKQPNDLLRRERELHGWSQRMVAERIGTDPQTVTRWELGENRTSKYFQTRLCELFGKNAEELGFLQPPAQTISQKLTTSLESDDDRHHEMVQMLNNHLLYEEKPREVDAHTQVLGNKNESENFFSYNTIQSTIKYGNQFTSIGESANSELLNSMINRTFSKDLMYDLLSSNIKTMSFRDEWQYIVNNLVSETRASLRAMVFDTELTRWWNSIVGQLYMKTNMELLKSKISVKRIFILSSIDMRLRMNTLMNAYIHHKLGIDVRVCTVTGFQNTLPFKPDMFSVHDNSFVALYYFSYERPITNLLLENKYISEFSSFYDELFRDDRLCTPIESILARANYGESFFASIQTQLEFLKRLDRVETVTALTRRL